MFNFVYIRCNLNVVCNTIHYVLTDSDGWKLNVTVYFDVVGAVVGSIEAAIDELGSRSSSVVTVSRDNLVVTLILTASTVTNIIIL